MSIKSKIVAILIVTMVMQNVVYADIKRDVITDIATSSNAIENDDILDDILDDATESNATISNATMSNILKTRTYVPDGVKIATPSNLGQDRQIIGYDNRTRVTDATKFPHCCTAMIELRTKVYVKGVELDYSICYGSGSLIGEAVFMTSGHVLDYEYYYCPKDIFDKDFESEGMSKDSIERLYDRSVVYYDLPLTEKELKDKNLVKLKQYFILDMYFAYNPRYTEYNYNYKVTLDVTDKHSNIIQMDLDVDDVHDTVNSYEKGSRERITNIASRDIAIIDLSNSSNPYIHELVGYVGISAERMDDKTCYLSGYPVGLSSYTDREGAEQTRFVDETTYSRIRNLSVEIIEPTVKDTHLRIPVQHGGKMNSYNTRDSIDVQFHNELYSDDYYFYYIDTMSGQSGTPLWYSPFTFGSKNREDITIYGVHSASWSKIYNWVIGGQSRSRTVELNLGAKISQDMVNTLVKQGYLSVKER